MPNSGESGFRHRLRQQLHRWEGKSQSLSPSPNTDLSQLQAQREISIATSYNLSAQPTKLTDSSKPYDVTGDPRQSTNTASGDTQTPATQAPVDRRNLGLSVAEPSTCFVNIDSKDVSSDIWSAAYREAVESSDGLDLALLEGKNVSQLFKNLKAIESDPTRDSIFKKGLSCLRKLKPALENFQLVLDLATPLASIEPVATTVVGMTKSVTAIAISFASADLNFAQQIAEMLEQIQYIDQCDTLGQKADCEDIHRALVSVYQKILEFYKAAFEIITKNGVKLILNMVVENGRLPKIVQDFLSRSDILRKLISKAILDITDDIKKMVYDREIYTWLGSDILKQQNQLHTTWRDLRADEACEFLLEDQQLLNWYNLSDHRQLVVLGHMGIGKTIAMSFLIDTLCRGNKQQLPQPKVCWYYCRDDGTGNSVAIFSGLLLSLLTQLEGLKKQFVERYRKAKESGFDPAVNPRKLEELLQDTLEATDRLVFIVIDGFDECDMNSRHCILTFLTRFSAKTPRLKFLLSCRPDEDIMEQLSEIPTIKVSPNSQRDRIIARRTVEKELPHLSENMKVTVIDRLSDLSRGSAVWTKHVVALIKTRKIRSPGPMQALLQDNYLPKGLSDLYNKLISRNTLDDPDNEEVASAALKILAIRQRPLSILELGWAVTLSTTANVATISALSDLVDHQRVLSLIQPFILPVDFGDLKKRQVKLSHQSAKEFIVEKWCTQFSQQMNSSAPIRGGQNIAGQRFESLEAFILDICFRYLLLDDIGTRTIFSEEQVAISELPQEFDLFSDDLNSSSYTTHCTWEVWEEGLSRYDPAERGLGEFFVYASCYWIKHFNSITSKPLPSLANVEKLCQAGSTLLHNWTEQNSRPDCVILARFDFDSRLHDPLSITALYASQEMLYHLLESSSFAAYTYLRGSVMNAADQVLQWGDLARLKILVSDARLGHQLRNLDFFRLVIQRWRTHLTNHQNWESAFDLVEEVLDEMIQEQWGDKLLSMADSLRCMPIIERLLTSARKRNDLKEILQTASCYNDLELSVTSLRH